MNSNPLNQAEAPKVITRTIKAVRDTKNFENQFFGPKFKNVIKGKEWKDFNWQTIPVRMSEIVNLCRGKYKKDRTIDIDLTAPGKDQLFLSYIVYFTRGKTSAAYNRSPFSFIIQPQEYQDKVLNTKLIIKLPKKMTPKVSTSSFQLF